MHSNFTHFLGGGEFCNSPLNYNLYDYNSIVLKLVLALKNRLTSAGMTLPRANFGNKYNGFKAFT